MYTAHGSEWRSDALLIRTRGAAEPFLPMLRLTDLNVWLVGLFIATVLLLVASAATWLAARQAARVDPASTLRAD